VIGIRNLATGLAVALCLLASGCGGPSRGPSGAPVTLGGEGEPSNAGGSEKDAQADQPRKVDPRQDGFEIGFGEYAVTLEAPAIRPGRVTFEVHNGGKLVHGFEMEAEGADGDSSGPGSGGDDGFKIEKPSFRPGQTIRFPLNLAAGMYKVECWVDGHDDLGMEILLDVRPDAPLVRQQPAGASGDAVTIEGFAFEPETLSVASGTEVTWTNADPEAHTVTARDDSFDSGPIDPGRDFAVALDQSGSVTYFCAIHPSMEGTLEVTG
jgi:plastocyanin